MILKYPSPVILSNFFTMLILWCKLLTLLELPVTTHSCLPPPSANKLRPSSSILLCSHHSLISFVYLLNGSHNQISCRFTISFSRVSYSCPQYLFEWPSKPQMKQKVGSFSYLNVIHTHPSLVFHTTILRFNGLDRSILTLTLMYSFRPLIKFLKQDST